MGVEKKESERERVENFSLLQPIRQFFPPPELGTTTTTRSKESEKKVERGAKQGDNLIKGRGGGEWVERV